VLERPQHPYTRRLLAAVARPDAASPPCVGDAPVACAAPGLRRPIAATIGSTRSARSPPVKSVNFEIRRGENARPCRGSGSGKSTIGHS